MADIDVAGALRAVGADEAAAVVRDFCEPLPSLDEVDDFGECFDRFGDAKVVLLGEATHGTSQFYRARAAITRRLIERHGFNIVAVEADWPDAARIDRHVRHHPHEASAEEAFARFPTWMWRNVEMHDFVEWLRTHNAKLPSRQRVQFSGLDIYSLGASIAAVLAYLGRVDPQEAMKARQRYGCLTPWQNDPSRYGSATRFLDKSPCEDAVVAQLRELLDNRLIYLRREGDFFDAEQNARIVHTAEHYYRLMYRSATDSWNLRDRHMFDTLARLLTARGNEAKAVVWAHNSHVGNAAATAMGWQGEFNIGESCRAAFGEAAALIGFGTDRGTVAAADDWGGPMRLKTILPCRPDSYERVFRQAFVEKSLTDWRTGDKKELRDVLSKPRLERAIGVVYRPDTELYSHYFEAILPDQFDAYVWFEETTPVTPLSGAKPHGAPDTYPFGL
ncbi:erythromycin esterase family protein [Methylocella tundrae]|uniref:Erythromycin esterase homolog n=1 Tax=Methylocella tundrae TaxID=227605 RepID=A0A4U8Z7F8_METTU|nr:erythromycin esterase family protein [Methylocella tundrae]WPP03066.1 erythromycin esterase family protein [Methylocella tundrae]VFU16326.1 Erythromycin esterase homolog [Methylocella tundrae]